MNNEESLTMHDKPKEAIRKKNNLQRILIVILVSIVVMFLCFGAGVIGAIAVTKFDSLKGSAGVLRFAGSDGNSVTSKNEQAIASVVESVSPSVVSIVTTSTSSRGYGDRQAAGTGMIVSSNGYVLTNNHVIENANNVSIISSNGVTYDNVKVVGRDPLNDIAFLKIKEASDLPAVTLGDSKTVRPGQSVIAIGNALGQYQNTVTSGIISGLGRPVSAGSDDEESGNVENLSDLLQTDAAINAGNSGGPLLNTLGQVVGINTAVAQDANSIGFAIPIGAAKGTLKHLVSTGKVERAYIGLQFIPITPDVREEYKLKVTNGDLVSAASGSAVRSGSPADKAGIKNNDIITKVNDIEVGPGRSISTLVGEYQPGETVKLTIIRNEKTIIVDVKLATFTS